MRFLSILAVGLTIAMGPLSAQAASQLPIEVRNGSDVEVRGASAKRDETGVGVHGWVYRRVGSHGLIDAHLHIEGVGREGATLEMTSAHWSGSLGTRTRTPRAFKAKFDIATAASIERVRVSVQPGRRHKAGE